ncbi:MAG: branched-chain amino acid ABC transporter permease [Actinomycetota bacterium]|nr:branched-chain amino acid ABC transporter permease [Actinomycetota bacterium]MDQ2697396.1 branched-chain amino acid ABC transporter permease [Actinomycetota bacterium]
MDAMLVGQLVLNGLSFGALLFLVASGFTLVFGLMRISNLAHGAFYLVGAYVAIATVVATGNFWLGLVAGALSAALVGLVSERGLLRQVRGKEMPEVLVTVGISFVIADMLLAFFGGDPKSIGLSGAPSGSVSVGELTYPAYRLFIIGVTVLIGVVMMYLQKRTTIGAVVRAGVDNREMTAGVGINIDRVFTGVFVFGSALAGVAGAIGAGLLSLNPNSGTEMLLFAMVVVIIGGLGSIPGAAIGAVLIGIIDAFAKAYLPEFSYFTVFAPMALVLVFRPYGLLGRPA